MKRLILFFIAFAVVVSGPGAAFAQTAKTGPAYSAWIPYWKKDTSAAELSAHLSTFTELSPFGYSVAKDGTLIDTAKINEAPWPDLIAKMREQKVKVIPTIMWSDRAAIYDVLTWKKKRAVHVANILAEVKKGGYDGIDIDYENKSVETRAGFSAFLRDLGLALDKEKKTLSCTIEARTPPTSLYKIIPSTLAYVNDYKVINTYCDTVRIMAYDQMTADITLNSLKGKTSLYAPVADVDWVGKVVDLAIKSISPKKIMLGVPTYGYEYEATKFGSSYRYTKLRSHTYKTAIDLAVSVGATPVRTGGGELSFAYMKATSTRIVTFSDATSVDHKISIAKDRKLRGISLFKIDNENDPLIWTVLK